MSTGYVISDPKGDVGSPTWLHRLFLPVLRDPRDVVFVDLAVQISCVVVPLAVGLFLLPTWAVAVAALPYLGFVMARYGGPYTLMLHAIGHRKTFTNMAFHYWISLVLAPFFGHTPGSFFAHHVGMHHPENNLADDLSSTMAYQRDKVSHFLHYWARFFFVGYIHLVRYFYQRGRTKLMRQFLAAELGWLALVVLGLSINPAAALVVLVIPFCIMRLMMMAGNWAQHAFVDIEDGNNAYRNSTCLTNAAYNHNCFNDGYHIVHHLKPTMHWAEMPKWFERNQTEFIAQDAIVFDGIRNNQIVFWWLMNDRYDLLAEHIWAPGKETRDMSERVAWLRGRVRGRLGDIDGFLEFAEPPRAVPQV